MATGMVYKVVCEMGLAEFEGLVNAYLGLGWELVGGVFVINDTRTCSITYYQTLVKTPDIYGR